MKAIIFDIDNTLIDWKDEFIFSLRKLLKEIYPNITEEKIKEIDYVIDTNESYLKSLDKNVLLQEIMTRCNIILPNDFIDKLIIYQGNCFYEDDELIETIKYLASKYDLYVISNWFTKTQKIRLENMKIAKYFKKIIGGDENYFKPDTRCFDVILKEYDVNECMYVGDKLEIDIKPALSIGMDAIWKTNEESYEFKTIKSIYELKNIL